MKIDNRTLVDLFREYLELNTASPKDDCPSSESLANSFMPSTSQRKKKRIADHISRCKSCREEFMILLQLQQSDTSSVSAQDNKVRTGHLCRFFPKPFNISPLFRFSSVLLGLVLITTSALLIIQSNERSRAFRSGDVGINLLYPVNKHPRSEKLIFQWKRQPESEYYVLELFDEALLPLWTSQKITVLQTQLPDDIHSSLQIGQFYFWMVTGFSEDLKIDESPLGRFIFVDKP